MNHGTDITDDGYDDDSSMSEQDQDFVSFLRTKLRAASDYKDAQGYAGAKEQQAFENLTGESGDSLEYPIPARGDDAAIASLWDARFGYMPGLPGRPGGSSYVSQQILQAVEWAKPMFVRVLLNQRRIVEFVASGPEDEAMSAQATEIVNHLLLKSPVIKNAFIEYTSAIDNGLMFPNSYAALWSDNSVQRKGHVRHGLLPHEVEDLYNDPTIRFIGEPEESQEFMEGPDGQKQEISVFKVEYVRTTTKPHMVFKALPEEEILVDAGWQDHSLEGCPFVARRCEMTVSDLRAMGYDISEEEAEELATGPPGGTTEETARYSEAYRARVGNYDVDAYDESSGMNPALIPVQYTECIVTYDYDDDGFAEMRKACLVNGRLKSNHMTDYMPYINGSVIVLPNRHWGMSLAQTIYSLQELISFLTRTIIDNSIQLVDRKVVAPETAFSPASNTEQDLRNPAEPVVKARGMPSRDFLIIDPINAIPDVSAVLQHIQTTVAERSGVATDVAKAPEQIQQTAYGAVMETMEKSVERMELMIRTFAETMFVPMALKAYRLIKDNPGLLRGVKIKGQFVNPDTSMWPEREDVRPVVGLGFPNKNQHITALSQLLGMQEQLGPTFVKDENVYNVVKEWCEATGVGPVTDFARNPTDPNEEPPPEEPPDPNAVKAQMDMQAKMMEIQLKQKELELDQAKAQMQQQTELQKEQMRGQIDNMRVQGTLQNERTKIAYEKEQAKLQAQIDALEGEREDMKFKLEERVAGIEMEKTEAEIEETLAKAEHLKAQSVSERRGDNESGDGSSGDGSKKSS